MSQEKVWEKEYQTRRLITGHDKPQADVLRFLKYLKKNYQIDFSGLKVLDLGSGMGRNANYLASLGCTVVGIEISDTAIREAQSRANNLTNKPRYLKQSMGVDWPVKDHSFDLVLDIISSNSLNESERTVYLNELKRVLRPGGLIYVKTLCKDGDKNAQNLIAKSPGSEKDTYILPGLNLTERVFTEEDFRNAYMDFQIVYLRKKLSRIPFDGQIYKRKFISAYLMAS